MTPRITLAVTRRVLLQLRRDHRTLVMLLILPTLVMALLWWIFSELPGDGFSGLAPALLALIPFIVMFLVTSVTTLRERTSGTLERLLAMPTGKGDFVGGYAIAFGLVAAVQAAVAVGVSLWLLDLGLAGPAWMLLVVAVVDAVLGSSLGLFVSAFARTEFQAVQFMPAITIPQVLLCGLFVPREELPDVLRVLSDWMPLSYAVDAMTKVARDADPDLWGDVAVVVVFAVAGLALGALTLRRRTD